MMALAAFQSAFHFFQAYENWSFAKGLLDPILFTATAVIYVITVISRVTVEIW